MRFLYNMAVNITGLFMTKVMFNSIIDLVNMKKSTLTSQVLKVRHKLASKYQNLSLWRSRDWSQMALYLIVGIKTRLFCNVLSH